MEKDKLLRKIESIVAGTTEDYSEGFSEAEIKELDLHFEKFAVERGDVTMLSGPFQNYEYVPEVGLYKLIPKGSDGKQRVFLCSPIRVLADTRDANKESWGRLVEFPDREGVLHRTVVLNSDLHDLATIPRLTNLGLRAAGRSKHEDILEFLRTRKVDKFALCVDRVGWANDSTYVLSESEILGLSDEKIAFQGSLKQVTKESGTLAQWKEHVGALCVGNSRLVLGVSAAFAGPLLRPLNDESGGFHFRGVSSCGKSTALDVASSACGSRKENWRATANGLEAIAAAHNDGLLCLDEMAQIDPRTAGEAIYMLANCKGKARMSKTLEARPPLEWRLVILSSGELGLGDHVAATGGRVRGGQETRLVDIEADAGRGLGLFENIHGEADGDAFAKRLRKATTQFHGSAFRAFLRYLLPIPAETLQDRLKIIRDGMLSECPGCTGEVSRVAGRFAIVALAGELATEAGATGWPEGEAKAAATKCFHTWRKARGRGSHDSNVVIAEIRRFIEAHSQTRFRAETPSLGTDTVVRECVGVVRHAKNGSTQYCFYREGFKQVVKGYNPELAIRALKERGYLVVGNDGKNTQAVTVPGTKVRQRMVVIHENILSGDPEF